MKIFPIVANRIYSANPILSTKKSEPNIFITNPIPFDSVSFNGIKGTGNSLKKLAEYGLPDMYTGQPMLSYGALSRILKNGVFDLPLEKLVHVLIKYEDTLQDTEYYLFDLLRNIAKKKPDISINSAFLLMFSEHQEKLLNIQRPIFEKIANKACDLPKEYYDEVMDLMRYTNKKIAKDPTIAHFSEKEFIYRLQQVAKQIKAKQRHSEVFAINRLIREAKTIFSKQVDEKKKFGRGAAAKKLKMEYQMQPAILKQNTQNLQYLRGLLEKSSLKNNRDLLNIFKITSAKIIGFPIVEPFKRQEFIYDLKNILKFSNDKNLEGELIGIAHELPTSAESVSAFIVKHVNDTPEKIGYYMLKGSLCSIEHIDPKVQQVKDNTLKTAGKKKKKRKKSNSVGGKNNIRNYGLSAAYINSLRSNMPFDDWVRQNPQAYRTCQKYVDRLIELYNTGKFDKVGLDKSYISAFADRVQSLSPAEKPIILDLSGLKS